MELAADLVNPLLGLCLVLGTWRSMRAGKLDHPRRYVIRAAAGAGLVFAFTALDRSFGWWSSIHLDFSTHMALAVSFATSLVVLHRGCVWFVLPLLVAYAVWMRRLGFHTPADSLTSGGVAFALTALLHFRPRPAADGVL